MLLVVVRYSASCSNLPRGLSWQTKSEASYTPFSLQLHLQYLNVESAPAVPNEPKERVDRLINALTSSVNSAFAAVKALDDVG